jgi:hypothetical protein
MERACLLSGVITRARAEWFGPVIAATFLCLTPAGCTADECMQHWLAWRSGNGPYSAVCPADRAMDRDRQRGFR